MVEQKTSPNGAGNPPANPSSRARQHRLLEIRENLPARTTAKTATPAVAGSLEGEAKPNSQGGELNDFIRQLVDRREQRRHQLEIIQDFFENPVEFGIEADVIPSGTPLEEIRERRRSCVTASTSFAASSRRSKASTSCSRMRRCPPSDRRAIRSSSRAVRPSPAPAEAARNLA